jgi:hypothetical protein
MFTNTERMAALKKASPIVVDLYSSLETARLIKRIRERNDITNDIIVDIVGDIILGLYPKHMLVSQLTEQLGLTWKTAGDIASELGHLLDAIPSATEPVVKQAVITDTQSMTEVGVVPNVTSEIRSVRTTTANPKSIQSEQPLTREELMQALERRQATSGSNIEAMRQKLEQAANQKTVGYDAMEESDR